METLLQYLNGIYPLGDNLKSRLAELLQSRELTKKSYLLKSGHVCQHIYFIERGLLRCFYLNHEAEVCSWFMAEGDVITSVESFFNQTRSYESIQALEDCTLHYISFKDLETLYKDFPHFNYIGRVLTQKYYKLSEQRLYSIRMQRASERYEYLIEHHSELVLRVPAKYLASYLGITEVTMSKIKGRR